MHNENAYAKHWPMRVWFFCVQPALEGGETPLADSRAVLARLRPEVRERFMRYGVRYVRNYGAGVDLPWQEVFQTTDRAEVEAYCRAANIEFEWLGDGKLRTAQVCQAVATHPKTGEMVWFNQAHLFHVSNVGPEVEQSLRAVFGQEGLPRNAFYGDGAPIEPEVLEEIRAAYAAESIRFAWQTGDIAVVAMAQVWDFAINNDTPPEV